MQLLKLLLVLILILTIVSPVLAGEKWKMTSLAWGPYSGHDLPQQGRSIAKLRKALQACNIELVVEFFPWARAKVTAAQPGYVGYFPAWPEEVKGGFIASPPVDWSKIAIMSRDKINLPKDLDSIFATNIVGLIKNYTYPEEIEKIAKRHKRNIDEAPDENSLVRKLIRGRCDLAITDPEVMKYYAKKNGLKNIVVVKEISTNPLVFAIKKSEKSEHVLKILKKALNKEPCAR